MASPATESSGRGGRTGCHAYLPGCAGVTSSRSAAGTAAAEAGGATCAQRNRNGPGPSLERGLLSCRCMCKFAQPTMNWPRRIARGVVATSSTFGSRHRRARGRNAHGPGQLIAGAHRRGFGGRNREEGPSQYWTWVVPPDVPATPRSCPRERSGGSRGKLQIIFGAILASSLLGGAVSGVIRVHTLLAEAVAGGDPSPEATYAFLAYVLVAATALAGLFCSRRQGIGNGRSLPG